MTYTGQWKLFDGVKMKHGQGTLAVSTDPVATESYEGGWAHDQMDGYGVYKYANGALYEGEWKANMHHGQGKYTFPNGTLYEGSWEHHLMHGTGYLIDHRGHKWDGEFRNGKFETQMQKELVKEKHLKLKLKGLQKGLASALQVFSDALGRSDKKTLKENISPLLATADAAKELVKEPYPKLEERPL